MARALLRKVAPRAREEGTECPRVFAYGRAKEIRTREKWSRRRGNAPEGKSTLSLAVRPEGESASEIVKDVRDRDTPGQAEERLPSSGRERAPCVEDRPETSGTYSQV